MQKTFCALFTTFAMAISSTFSSNTPRFRNGFNDYYPSNSAPAPHSSPSDEYCQAISDSHQCERAGCCLLKYTRPAGYTRRLMRVTECTGPLQDADTCLRFNEENTFIYDYLMKSAGHNRQLAAMMCPCQLGLECPVTDGDVVSTCQPRDGPTTTPVPPPTSKKPLRIVTYNNRRV